MSISKELPDEYYNLTERDVLARLTAAKKKLGSKIVILGHHYQRDDIIRFADYTGDSFKLARISAGIDDIEYIIFCGVHFMAESADLLCKGGQKVLIPDKRAGCPMADMARLSDAEKAWEEITSLRSDMIPVTYVNSSAEIKHFCGKHGGIVCTSGNADKIFDWVKSQDKKIFFLPDEHLGRYVSLKKGMKKLIVWDYRHENGGNSASDIKNAEGILWKGFCNVHMRFTPEDVDKTRQQFPEARVIVHPECKIDVIEKADDCGSTEYIIDQVSKGEKGSTWAIGTEVNLVSRLAKRFPDKRIFSLRSSGSLCVNMYKINPKKLLFVLESLIKGEEVNVIRVPDKYREYAKLSLERMLEASK